MCRKLLCLCRPIAKNVPPGMAADAGDIIEDGNTTCDAILCSADEYVSFHVCTSCPDGTTNAAGDDASGETQNVTPLHVLLMSPSFPCLHDLSSWYDECRR